MSNEESKPKRSPRAAARRETLRQLTDIKSKLETMQQWWSARTTVYLEPAERVEASRYTRPRELGEYPEAQRRYWAGTVAGIDAMIQDLYVLREHCVRECNETPED